MYDPSSLPTIDSLDVLVLSFFPSNSEHDFLRKRDGFPILMSTRVTDSRVVDSVAQLWRDLPSHEQSRCHTPPFGIRFHMADTVILEASICWHCDNIWIVENDEFKGYEFAAHSHPSQTLLRLLRYLSGEYLSNGSMDSYSVNDYL